MIQNSPEPMIRRTVKCFRFGCAARDAWMFRRPRMHSPDEDIEHRVLAIDLVLALEIVGVGRRPMAIQSRSNLTGLPY